MRKVGAIVPGLNVVDIDIPLSHLDKDDARFEQVVLGREFHVSLGRTVPIRVHQRDSIVSMLRQKLQFQKRWDRFPDNLLLRMHILIRCFMDVHACLQNGDRYLIDFSKWEVFVNDDHSRTFLSVEVTAGGLAEVRQHFRWTSFYSSCFLQFHNLELSLEFLCWLLLILWF